MSQPYVGEIRMGGWMFAPVGWAFCLGQLIPISENDTLFNLIGTTFGGDGQETFGLPDLQGRVPLHQGGGFTIGEVGGEESVTLSTQQMPNHTHVLMANQTQGNLPDPGNNVLARTSTPGVFPYVQDTPDVQLAQSAVTPDGGSQAHDNLGPFQCITYIISLYGIYPLQS